MKKTISALLIALSAFALPQFGHAERIHHVIGTSAIIDVVGDYETNGILLVRRWKEPVGIALPSSTLLYGESIEDSVQRGIREETGLQVANLRLSRVYSDPLRDPRYHLIEFVFTGEVSSSEVPVPGVDIDQVLVVKFDEIPWHEMALNQAEILRDYFSTQCCRIDEIQIDTLNNE